MLGLSLHQLIKASAVLVAAVAVVVLAAFLAGFSGTDAVTRSPKIAFGDLVSSGSVTSGSISIDFLQDEPDLQSPIGDATEAAQTSNLRSG